MSQKDFFIEYHHKQAQIVKSIADKLNTQNIIKHYSDIYPDLYNKFGQNNNLAYVRGSVPLKLVSLFYDPVIVFIPPISKEMIEARFQLKYNELIKLCQQNIVIPIIGNVLYYTSDHFKEILNLPSQPPSLWARGLSILDIFGMNDCLEKAKSKLPMNKIANDKKILRSYKNYKGVNIKEKIRKDVALFYADLCIFGHESDIEIIREFDEPSEIYDSLEMMNEIKTYPILFGLGGQPNYNIDKMKTLILNNKNFEPITIPKEIEILLDGIGINGNCISVDQIIEYRFTELGKYLRNILISFNECCIKNESWDIYSYYQKAELFQKTLKKALDELSIKKQLSSLDNTQKIITNIFKIGGISIGGLPAVPAINGSSIDYFLLASSIFVSGVFSFVTSFPDELAAKIIKMGINIPKLCVPANIWSARRIVSGKK